MAPSRTRRGSGWLPGLILILILLAAVGAGGYFVLHAVFPGWFSPEPESQPSVGRTLPETAQPEPAPEPEPEPEPEQFVTLMALGDDLVHNCVYWSAELPEGGYDFTPFFEDIRPVAEQYDIACIQQETILVRDRSMIASYPVFGTPVEIADALEWAGFDVLTCASNHCFDKGETGVTDTLGYLRESCPGLTALGIHDSESDLQTPCVIEKNGIRIAMLNFTYGLNGMMPQKTWMVDTFDDPDTVSARVQQAKAVSDFVIVFAHWGTEDTFRPDAYQESWAQILADAGAGLIIGCHTHTLQPLGAVSVRGGSDVPVFWSLGNFLSHQIEPKNMLGGMASVTLRKSGDTVTVEECELIPTVTVIIRNTEGDWYRYRPMLLSDYTPEIAATHRVEGCSVEQMQKLFRQITEG